MVGHHGLVHGYNVIQHRRGAALTVNTSLTGSPYIFQVVMKILFIAPCVRPIAFHAEVFFYSCNDASDDVHISLGLLGTLMVQILNVFVIFDFRHDEVE